MAQMRIHFLLLLYILTRLLPIALALEDPASLNQEIGITQRLGGQIDLDLTFVDTSGRSVPLREYFETGKPVILIPVYYGCPRLCGLVLDGVLSLLSEISLDLASEYEVITVSFDSSESSSLAQQKQGHYFGRLKERREFNNKGWNFLVGQEQNVGVLMEQIGFKYKKEGRDFAHSAMLVVFTPGGEISQYFFGITFPAWDVKLALVEASHGGVGSFLDHALLFCFRFDPIKGRYTWLALGMLKVGGILTLMCMGGMFFLLRRRYERARASGAS